MEKSKVSKLENENQKEKKNNNMEKSKVSKLENEKEECLKNSSQNDSKLSVIDNKNISSDLISKLELEQVCKDGLSLKDKTLLESAEELTGMQEKVSSDLTSKIDFHSQIIVRGKNNVKAFRRYNFQQKVGSHTHFEISDKRAIDSIDRITMVNTMTERADLLICYELAQLAENKALFAETDMDVQKFAKGLWGIDSKTVNQYVRIGSLFVKHDEMGYSLIDSVPQSLKKSQLLEFLAYIGKSFDIITDDGVQTLDFNMDTIEDLYADGILKDGMSSKAIRKALKDYVGKTSENKKDNKEDKKENNKSTSKLDNSDSMTRDEKIEYAKEVTTELQSIIDIMIVDGCFSDDIVNNVNNSIDYIRKQIMTLVMESVENN